MSNQRRLNGVGKDIRITYRGWPGHFIASRHCVFRLNTLIELGDVRVVVSTVGNMIVPYSAVAEEVGCGRYYETMAFHASLRDNYWDANVGRQVDIPGTWTVDKINSLSDHKAQAMHEDAVQDISQRILSGELTRYA